MKKIIALVAGLMVSGSAFGADEAPKLETVRLITSDGISIEMEHNVAMQSETLKNLLDDLDADELEGGIPLPHIDRATLEKLIPLMQKQSELKNIVASLEIEGETPKTDKQLTASLTGFTQEQKLTLQDMPALARAANYLDLGPGLQAVINHYADLLHNLDNQQAIIDHFFKKSHTLSIDGGEEREYPGLTEALSTQHYRDVIPTELLMEVIQAYYARHGKHLDFNLLPGQKGNWPRKGFSIRILLRKDNPNRYEYIYTNQKLEQERARFQERLTRFQNSNEKILSLRDMNIESLNDLQDIPGIGQCSLLDLYKNEITAINPKAFQGLDSLSQITLSFNQLTKIPTEALEALTNLNALAINDNQITKLQPGTFQGLHKLEDLWLNNNQLTEIRPGAFDGLENLQKLILWGNPIANDAAAIARIRTELPEGARIITK